MTEPDHPHRLNEAQARALHRLMADGVDAKRPDGNDANGAELVAICGIGDPIGLDQFPDDTPGERTLGVIALEPDGTPENPTRAWQLVGAGIAWPIDNDLAEVKP